MLRVFEYGSPFPTAILSTQGAEAIVRFLGRRGVHRRAQDCKLIFEGAYIYEYRFRHTEAHRLETALSGIPRIKPAEIDGLKRESIKRRLAHEKAAVDGKRLKKLGGILGGILAAAAPAASPSGSAAPASDSPPTPAADPAPRRPAAAAAAPKREPTSGEPADWMRKPRPGRLG